MPGRRWTLALCGWTLFVWTTRIGNIWRDEALDDAAKVGSTALALSFTVLAVTVLVASLRRWAWVRTAVVALAVWTASVWAVRLVGIAQDGHDAAFVAVHAVLAVVSVGLSVLAVREQAPASARPSVSV